MNKDSWEIKTMGEIGFIITGNTPKTSISQNYDSKDINFVKPSDILNNEITFLDSSESYISEFARDKARILPIGSVLVTCIGIIGKIAITNKEVAINQQINAIVPSNNILSEFLAYSLLNAKDTLNRIANAPVVPIINKTQFSALTISVPSITIQEQIVKELDTLSDIITKKKEQLAELDKLAQATFYDMFGDPVENEKGWDIRGLEKICTQIVDCPHSTPIKSETKTLYPCIRTSELKNGSINWDSMQYVEQEEYLKRTKRLTPKAGDIIYGREGSYGDAVCLPNTGHNFCLGQRTMLFRPNSQILNSTYLLKFIISDYVYSQARNKNAGSTVGHVNVSDIKKFNILCPPLSLQNQFAEKIEAIEKQKALINQSITDTQLLFDYTMDKYFN